MRIVAITKTFRGEEFALESLASIYKHMFRIIYVHSDIAWNGDKGNTVREVVKGAPDPAEKVVHIDKEGTQNDQYNAALEWLHENEVKYDYLMLIDTDEVWEESAWEKTLAALESNLKENQPAMAIRTGLYDYIKSPFYRVDPPSPLVPVVFVHRDAVALNALDVRGTNVVPCKILRDVFFHHFCSVRKRLSDVWNKHKTSCGAEDEPMVSRDAWIKTVWNQLPWAVNCLPLLKYSQNWRRIKVCELSDLPILLHDNALVKAWVKYPQLICGTYLLEQSNTLVKAGLPPDFGPGHADWKMPSKRRKYEIALGLAANNG